MDESPAGESVAYWPKRKINHMEYKKLEDVLRDADPKVSIITGTELKAASDLLEQERSSIGLMADEVTGDVLCRLASFLFEDWKYAKTEEANHANLRTASELIGASIQLGMEVQRQRYKRTN